MFERINKLEMEQKQKEIPENFEQGADLLLEEGDQLMAKNHGFEGDQKVYHTLEEHIGPLQERAERMGDILGLSIEQRKLIAVAISWHDTTIEYDAPDQENIVGMVRRHRGARKGDQPMETMGNEALSADAMEETMRRINANANKDIFSQEQIEKARWAIDATYPDVDLGPDWKGAEFEKKPAYYEKKESTLKESILYEEVVLKNPRVQEMLNFLRAHGITKGPHFFQPHLENPLEEGKQVPEEVMVVAMSDLGAAGLGGIDEFAREGDNEGKESYHNLRKPENIERLITGDENKDNEDRTRVATALLNWWGSQPGFAMWQMMRFIKIMNCMEKNGQLTLDKKEKFENLFSHYEENIKSAVERSERVKGEYEHIKESEGDKKAFEHLAQEMKYV